MKTMLKSLCVAAVLGMMTFSAPTSAKADQSPYWRNHWGWYDNTYRPYYNNYYGPTYGGGYYAPNYGYGGGYYSRPYYGGYNGYTGYNSFYGPTYVTPGVGVRVGRLNFGWW